MVTFTQVELAEAIQGAARKPMDTPNSITASELSDALGVNPRTARKLLGSALEAGLVSAEWVVRVSHHGVARRYEGYVLVERGEAS